MGRQRLIVLKSIKDKFVTLRVLFQKCFWVSKVKLSLLLLITDNNCQMLHLQIPCHLLSHPQIGQEHILERTQHFRELTVCRSGYLSLFWEANLLNQVETQVNGPFLVPGLNKKNLKHSRNHSQPPAQISHLFSPSYKPSPQPEALS